ncbi:MAG: malate permease [Chthoniobacter sp.]|nr:malate permease [Chthoniobacter sp.]
MLLWNVFSQVLLPILVMFGAGWLLERRCRLDLGTLVRSNIYLFVPAFIFVQIVRSDLTAELALRVVAFTGAIIAGMFILSALAGRLMGYPRPLTRSLQLATMFYNSANYGVPLMALAFPANGPLVQVFVIVTINVSTFTVGLLLAASAHRSGWRAWLPVLRQVSVWAVAAALIVRGFHLPVQQWRWLWVPLGYFSDALVGIALITLGAQISKTERPKHLSRLGWALGLRLLGGPLLAWALVGAFGFTGETAKIMILSAAFPTAVNTALIAHEFDADVHFAASAVFASTLFSMITVTLLISLLWVI